MSTQLPYRLELDNRRAIVSLLPELNEVPWADIERVGSEILSKIQSLPSPNLLVDLCALNYMGSAQVALVVRMFKMVKEKNGKMIVANRDPMVLEVLSLAGLNKVWTIVDSRERALSMLGGPATASASPGGAHPLPGLVAVTGAIVAAIFLVIHLVHPEAIPSRGDLYGILGGSAIAFFAGLWAMNGGNRNLGIGVIVISVAMLLYGVYEIAQPPTGQSAFPTQEGKGDAEHAMEKATAAAPRAQAEPKADAGTPAAIPPGAVPPAAPPSAPNATAKPQ
jgi:anti-anti-sigma factor